MKHDPFKFWTDPVVYFLVVLLTLVGVVVLTDRALGATGPDPSELANTFSITIDSMNGPTTSAHVWIPDIHADGLDYYYTLFAVENTPYTGTNLGEWSGYQHGLNDYTLLIHTSTERIYFHFAIYGYSAEYSPQHPDCDYNCTLPLPPNQRYTYGTTAPVDDWFGSSWAIKYLDISTSTGTSTENEFIEFVYPNAYPANNSSGTPDFSDYKIKVRNTLENTQYFVKIETTMTDGAVTSTPTSSQYMVDTFSFTGPVSSTNSYWKIRKSYTVTPDPQKDYYYTSIASLCLNLLCNYPVATTSVSYWTSRDATPMDTAYNSDIRFDTNYDYQYSASGKKLDGQKVYKDLATGNWCQDAPEGWADMIFWGFCKLGEFLIRPSNETTDLLVRNIVSAKDVFPFSIVFAVSENIVGSGLSSPSSKTLSVDLSSVPGPFQTYAVPLTILSSSTLSDVVGDDWKSQIITVEKYIIWAFTIGAIASALMI